MRKLKREIKYTKLTGRNDKRETNKRLNTKTMKQKGEYQRTRSADMERETEAKTKK